MFKFPTNCQLRINGWVPREELLAKADAAVIGLYGKMRPDAAAPQLAVMQEDAAAAILLKLNARTGSAILAEMEASRAASLSRRMSDLGRRLEEASKDTKDAPIKDARGTGPGGAPQTPANVRKDDRS